MNDVRFDKWLWAARFVKTRGLAQKAIEGGKARLNGERVKTAHVVRMGDRVWLDVFDVERTVAVIALSDLRRDATFAQTLYAETQESLSKRQQIAKEIESDLDSLRTKYGVFPSSTESIRETRERVG